MRKLLMLVLVCAAMLTLLPATALAADAGGIWGGTEWAFTVTDTATGNGTLTFKPIDEGRQTDPKTGQLYEKGYIKEAVSYDASGNATAVIATPWSAYASKVTKLVLEDGITGIGSWTLQKLPIRGDLFIPSTVKYIGYEALIGCGFSSVTFEEGSELTCIACAAFKDSTNLVSIELPEGLECIHMYAFQRCYKLESISIPASCKLLPGNAHNDFYKSKDTPNTPSWSGTYQICVGCPALLEVRFGDADQKRFMTDAILGGSSSGKTTPKIVAKVGTSALFDLQLALDTAFLRGIDTVTLERDISVEDITVPMGVTLVVPAGKTLTVNGTATNLGTIGGDGTFKSTDTYASSSGAKLTVANPIISGKTETVLAVSFYADEKPLGYAAVKAGADVRLPAIPQKEGYTGIWNHDGKNITTDLKISAVYVADGPVPETGDADMPLLYGLTAILALVALTIKRRKSA